jgi:hypothetical protein
VQSNIIEMLTLCFNAFHNLDAAFGICYPVIQVLFCSRYIFIGGSQGLEEAKNLQAVFYTLLGVDESNLPPVCLVRLEQRRSGPVLVNCSELKR